MRALYLTFLILAVSTLYKFHNIIQDKNNEIQYINFHNTDYEIRLKKSKQTCLELYAENIALRNELYLMKNKKEFDNKLGFGNATFYCDIGITRSGCPTRSGSIAVDPSKIELGTRIRLIGFPEDVAKWGIADDTGGMIKNNDIDIWLSSETRCRELGIIKTELNKKKDRFGEYIEVKRLYEINERKY